MSHTAFKDQLHSILMVLEKCNDLCDAIRRTRRTARLTPNLDAFQHAVMHTSSNLLSTFSTLRSAIGSRFDLGDSLARSSLDSYLRILYSMQTKLAQVAYGHDRTGSFQTLRYEVQTIESDILSVFSDLKYRLEASAKDDKPKPKPILKKPAGDVAIGIKKLDAYMDHMKNSWVETAVDGQLFYVNVFDEHKRQWDKPKTGFIQYLPRMEKPRRSRTWEKDFERELERERESEREARRWRNDPWRHSDGW